jgi:hypothetical protein
MEPTSPIDSNKQNFAYTVAITPDSTIKATVPIMDRLSLTIPISKNPKIVDGTVERLAAFIANPDNQVIASHKQSKFHRNFQLVDQHSGRSIFVQACPKYPNLAFARFDMNPAKLGVDGMRLWRRFVDQIWGADQAQAAIADATVTRVDFACDLVGVRIDALAVRPAHQKKSAIYYGIKGRVETYLVWCKKQKEADTEVYNKKAELEDHGHEPAYGDVEHTRVEIRSKTRRPIIKLFTQKNPFANLDIGYLPREAPGLPAHIWRHFCDSARYRTLPVALDLIPLEYRQPYLDALKAAPAIWFPNKVWTNWQDVLSSSGLLA